jgi:Putative zinc-finger
MMRSFYRRTQLLDSRSAWSAGNHDDVWELIPWYVNGSLPPEEMAVIQRHIAGCAECTLEVSRQRGLAGQIALDEPDEAATARSWKKLSTQIRSERDSGRKASRNAFRLGGFRGGLMLGGACAAACLLAIAVVLPVDSGFRTLTSNTSGGNEAIKFQTVAGLTPSQLETILADHGLKLVAGPSEGGVYTAVSVRSEADLEAAAQALMAAPQIIFAAPAK